MTKTPEHIEHMSTYPESRELSLMEVANKLVQCATNQINVHQTQQHLCQSCMIFCCAFDDSVVASVSFLC